MPQPPNTTVAPEDKKVITLGKELAPEDEAQLRERIKAARGGSPLDAVKGHHPVGRIEKPRFPILQPSTTGGPQLSNDLGAAGVNPRPAGSPVIRQETADQVGAFQAAQAQVRTDAQTALDEEALKKEVEEKQEKLFEAFDFVGNQNEAERIFNNKKRRKEIEDRCQPMKLQDLIMKDEVRQVVPVVPGEFEILFRSATPEESLFVKQIIARENSTSEAYSLEKYALCMLTCSLISINGKELPDHRKSDGSGPDEKMFEVKLKRVSKMSAYIVADLGTNYAWFDIRVRKLIAPDSLGNG